MGIGDFLYMFFVLGLLVAVMYGLLFLMKKYLLNFAPKSNSTSEISILASKTIMPKKNISIVKVGEKIYVLGISDNSISLIDKLEKDEFKIPVNNVVSFDGGGLKDMLKKNLGIK